MASKHFRRTLVRLLTAGVVILIAFPLGVFAYLQTIKVSSPLEVQNLKAAIDQASQHEIKVVVADRSFVIPAGQLKTWTEPYTRFYSLESDVRFTNKFDDFIAQISTKVSRDPVDARFTMNASGSATILVPSRPGQTLDPETAKSELYQGILKNQNVITLDTQPVQPTITEETIKNLGVNNLLAEGESSFAGSSAARIQNIKVSSKLYNGYILKPGEHFSFNTVLGSVVASTGYAPEKVIKNGKIEYEYGGGICQVSTTLFRAAVLAGFPILERKNHDFPVHYYEPQGFDATIYPGSSDLRFINDTGHLALLQTHIVGHNLYFEIYGTSDGRKVTLDGPHQYDIQPDGSMKATLSRTITYSSGAVKTDQFNSNYKSPALFPTEPNPYE